MLLMRPIAVPPAPCKRCNGADPTALVCHDVRSSALWLLAVTST